MGIRSRITAADNIPADQLKTPVGQPIDHYAARMVIENAIADNMDYLRMVALSAAVPIKADLDLQQALMACRLPALRLGSGQETGSTCILFRDFAEAVAEIRIEESGINAAIGRRADNPFLPDAGYAQTETRIPRLDDRTKRIRFVRPRTGHERRQCSSASIMVVGNSVLTTPSPIQRMVE